MKLKNILNLSAAMLGCLILTTPVYADSTLEKKKQRHEQQSNDVTNNHNKKLHRQYNRQSPSRQSTKKLSRKDSKSEVRHAKEKRRTSSRKHQNDRNSHHRHNRYDYPKQRHTDRHSYSRDHYRDHRHYELRGGKRLILATPRHRRYRDIFIVRPFGHSYFGYGHFFYDHDAWRWLAFSAITLKLLDMVDEQAQREHEAAQVRATTAEVGERIYWDTDDASGYVVTTREGTSSRGLTCREYQHTITVGGKTEEAYGTACLQPDGAWKIVN